jgi:hypothetical protein
VDVKDVSCINHFNCAILSGMLRLALTCLKYRGW